MVLRLRPSARKVWPACTQRRLRIGDGHSPALVGIVKRWATPVTNAAVAGLLSPSRGVAASGLTEKIKSSRKADPRTSQMTKDLETYGFESGTRQTALDVSLNNGTVHDEAEVDGEEWGKDAVTTAAGIARRKAKTGESSMGPSGEAIYLAPHFGCAPCG